MALIIVVCASGLGAGCLAPDDIASDDGTAPAAVDPHAQMPPLQPSPEQIARKASLRPPAPTVPSATFVAKPARDAAARVTPAVTWSVGLSASPPSLWPSQSTTLTATASMDVGPTPYYIRILDLDSNSFIATCGTGTTCQVSASRSAVQTSSFIAFVEDLQGNEVADSAGGFLFGALPVSWHGSGVGLTESATALAVGGTATLFASTSVDIGPSPFFVTVYDVTANTLLAEYGFGTGTTVAISQTTATTHAYRACFSDIGPSYPPPFLLECGATQYVTWSNSGQSVALSAPSTTFSNELVTATASIDVGPTPYYIQIYSIEDGSRLTVCGVGTTCTASFTPSTAGSHLVAFIGPFSTTLPPSGATAESAIVLTTQVPEPPR